MAMKSPERVDQATAVFSVRDVPAAGAESGSATDSDAAEDSATDSDDASADVSADADTPAKSGRDSESGSAEGSNSDADSDADSAEGSDSDSDEDSGSGTEPGSGDEPGDARLRAAVAAWVAGPRDGSADGASDAPEASGEDDEPAEAPEASSEDDEPEDAPEPSDAEPEAEAEAEADAEADADAEPDDAKPEADAEADDAEPETDVKPEADAEPSDAKPEAEADDAKPEADADAKPSEADAKPEADAEPSDAKPEAEAEADDAKPEADAEPDEAKPEADAEPDDAEPDDAEPDDVEPDDAKPDAGTPRVDQATAVFKAVKPPTKPPVDQPTQMLKSLGSGTGTGAKPAEAKPTGAKPDGAKPADAKPAEGKPAAAQPAKASPAQAGPAKAGPAESDAERTSKFVPLKKAHLGGSGALPEAVAAVGPERTTQQPLPPRPPLDLLAELTNTPPPPETRVRTAVRRVKIWTPLVLLLAVVFAVVQAVRPLPTPTLALTAKPTFTFGGDKVSLPWPAEGQGWMDVSGIGKMDHFGEQKPVPIGSVAKAMTAYVVLKDHPLQPGKDGPSIDVDAKAETEGGYDSGGESTLNTVKAGDKLSQKDALSAIMIPSANNIARLLARWDAGSEEAFVKKMNAAAKKLGMTGTTYTDPSGLKETTVSTAGDQVKLGNELVKIQALTDITKLPSWKDPSGKTWQNYNRLVPYNNAVGVKTGSTTKAGGNLLFAATKDAGGETVTVVGAVLGQHTAPIIDTVNAVSKTAMLAAQDAVKASAILKKGDVVGYVDDGLGGQTPVVVDKNVSAVGWAGLTVKLELGDGAAAIPHKAKAGTKVGVLKVGDGSGGAVEVPVSLQKDLTEPGFSAKLTRVG
ncbi:D-alanyl-D-alanine carboxypeptidase [Streptomyces antnestii]|uniref:D-alanyl-D-alanine carboxypeptidase n=2 Tax=Streptomyces antnestii TaxID=2494256 RepID=A0A437PGR8_9ACTN|nr:D-alanyl-D-alanine carboxypeptidase [Streptomyces sp. San01]